MATKNGMFRRLLLGLMLLLLAGVGNRVQASHVAAADIYWDYIGTGPNNLHYRVTLVLFKACEPNSATLGTTAPVIFNSTCAGPINRTLPMTAGPDTMDQLCANFAPINACRVPGSVWPAFERRIYSDTITLPVACTDWKVSFQLCCRNSAINNLQGAAGYNMYTEAGINNVARWNNSSPRFIVDPIPYLCQGQPAFFLNGPLDPNNDSMSTTNVSPTDPGMIPYAAGYSLADPIGSDPNNPYAVNANTGTATFTPLNTGKFVLAFECADYDRQTGTRLSYIRRDVQVAVLNCNASPPDIDTTPVNITGGSWNPTPPTGGYIVGCPNTPLTFEISGKSNTISNAVFLASTNNIVLPTSSFTVTGQGTSNPVGTFTWTPTGVDVGDYTIIFEAKDSTCNNNQPIVLKNYFVVFIKIVQGVRAGPDGFVCQLDAKPWQLSVSGPPGAIYQWTSLGGGAAQFLDDPNIPNPKANPPYNYTYVVEATNFTDQCKNKDTVNVVIDTSNSIVATPSEVVMCRPGYMQLTSQGKGNAPLKNMACGTQEIMTCSTPDVVEVQHTSATIPPVAAQVTTSNLYSIFPSYRTARMQILLSQYDLWRANLRPGTINKIGFSVNTATPTQYHNFTISLKCTEQNEISNDLGGMETGATLVYTAPGPVVVTPGWNEFDLDMPYSWDSTKSLIVEICYNNSAAGTAAHMDAVQTFTGLQNNQPLTQFAISSMNSGSGSICQVTGAPVTYYGSRPVVRFNYCPADTVPFQYTWRPGDFLSDSTTQNPLAYIAESTKFFVSTWGRNGCRVVDSIDIKVPVHEYSVWPEDTTFCEGEAFKMIATGDYDVIQWFEDTTLNESNPTFLTAESLDCQDCDEPVGTPVVSTNYYAVMIDKDGCADTFMVKAIVKELPEVNILNNDTTIKYGQRVQLLVAGAYLYSWQPVSTLSNPNIVNPVASPTEPTRYYVYGVAENGCRNMDSVKVDIDYRDQLFVPTAFTPNGDGRNDVFRVANLTFQRLLEFRVFNRWGQEIFSTTNPQAGWDGSWKGVPQDMGSYQYLIRVAYPDGFVETYKGDVTLVR